MDTKLPMELRDHMIPGKPTELLDGYLRFIAKDEIDRYLSVIEKWSGWNGGIPFATTAFGDVLSWTDDGYIAMNRLIDNRVDIILAGSSFFFDNINDKEYQKDYFDINLYQLAKSKFGYIDADECYTFEPIPALGGAKNLDHIGKGHIDEYLSIIISYTKS